MQSQDYLLTVLVLASAGAHGGEADGGMPVVAAPAVVEVSASRSDQRRLDTAASIVVGRDELLRYGDQNLADALKRVAGVTVGGVQGRASELRMRGLGNGYTQVLLNGQPVPAGFSIESLSPELVERVEVMRVAGAETGTQAIAGTINIVLRKSVDQARREIRPSVASSNAMMSPTLTAQMSGESAGSSYTVAATMAQRKAAEDSVAEELGMPTGGAVLLQRFTARREKSVQRSVDLGPRLNWTLPGGDTLSSQSFVRLMDLDIATGLDEDTIHGEPTRLPANDSRFRARAATLRTDLQWTHKREDGARWEIKAGINRFERSATNLFSAFEPAANLSGARLVDSSAAETGITLAGKLSQSLAGGHEIVAGWDSGRSRRTESRLEQSSFAFDTVGASDEQYAARLGRLALFVQDDWSVSAAWSISSGLRWESLSTSTQGNLLDHVKQRTHVLSPVIQSLYKLPGSRQLRLAVSRTFKAPTLLNLAQRRYTVDNNNSPNNPDMQGNPYLAPERAWGVDAAFEHYIGKIGMLGASAFARRIDDVIVDRLFQSGPTWISAPSNAGRADTWGIELEARFPVRAVFAAAPAIDLRANMARNWSQVAAIPGPGNRLANQVPLSANLGLDYRMHGVPASIGANFGFQAGGPVRLSERRGSWSGARRELELVGTWNPTAQSQWQLSAANLLQQDNRSTSTFSDHAGSLRTATTTPTPATVRLSFTRKLGI